MALRELGFPAICFNSEVVSVESDVVKRVVKKLKASYKYVVAFMDNDETGMEQNRKLSTAFRIKYASTIGPKDISDFYLRHKRKKTYKFVKKILKRIYVDESKGPVVPY